MMVYILWYVWWRRIWGMGRDVKPNIPTDVVLFESGYVSIIVLVMSKY